MEEGYKKESLSLLGSIALGTGVMIGAGIFALLGQVAELSGAWFPYIFLLGAVISAFSAYSYIKVSNTYPSVGGIAMILKKAYGKSTITASASLLMALSMRAWLPEPLALIPLNSSKLKTKNFGFQYWVLLFSWCFFDKYFGQQANRTNFAAHFIYQNYRDCDFCRWSSMGSWFFSGRVNTKSHRQY